MCGCLGSNDCVSCALRFIGKYHNAFFLKHLTEDEIFKYRDGLLISLGYGVSA